jgi:hypothetical protein
VTRAEPLSQAEVVMFVSVVQATTQLVEQAFRIVARIRKAQERRKGFAEVLMRHENELRDIKAIIEVIEDEDDLQTPSVVADVMRLQDIQTKLSELLTALDPLKTKSKLNQVARQFVQGSSDERKLNTIMDEVVHVKTALLLHIQMANIRFSSNVEKSLVANAAAIQRIDESLRDHLKTCQGLEIAQLLKGRSLAGENGQINVIDVTLLIVTEDGTVPLTWEELRLLNIKEDSDSSGDDTLVGDTQLPSRKLPVKTERIIQQNTVRHQAAQINGPATEIDLWKDVSRIVIKDNVAEDQALQINYATPWEVTSKLLNHHREKVASVPRPKRHDSAFQM